MKGNAGHLWALACLIGVVVLLLVLHARSNDTPDEKTVARRAIAEGCHLSPKSFFLERDLHGLGWDALRRSDRELVGSYGLGPRCFDPSPR